MMYVRYQMPAAAVLLLCGMIARAAAQTTGVYWEDFETRTSFPEWSTVATDPTYQNPIRTDRTPNGSRRFLGQFGAQTVTLSLPNLQPHDTVIVEFDWFIIGSMDGLDSFYADSFAIAEPNAGYYYCTSFSNFALTPPEPQARQAYPGTCGNGNFPAETGASERGTLGYHFDRANDAVYHMRLVIPHAFPNLALEITGNGLQQLYDESWGVDNVKVTLHAFHPGISAAAAMQFNAAPCAGGVDDTLWVHSTGVLPLSIDSAVITGSGGPFGIQAFSVVEPALPATVPPGDSIPVVVRRVVSPAGSYAATLRLVSNASPEGFQVDLTAVLQPDTPRVAMQKVSCGVPTFTVNDTCGLAAVALGPGSDNVAIETDPPPPATQTQARLRLLDPAKPGRYVLVANGVEVASGTIDFTAALEAPAILQASAFGADGCGTVTVHNRQSAGIWIDAAWMRRNIAFSIPPAQLPLWIPPGESRDLIVCYQPGIDAEPGAGDTLVLHMACDSMAILLEGLSQPAFSGSGSNCNATIGFRPAGTAKPVVLVRTPVLEPDGSAISVVIERAAPLAAPDEELTVNVVDMLGRPVSSAATLHPATSVRDGVRSSVCTYRALLGGCPSGPYMLVIAAPDGPVVRPFLLVR
ncbi:MAG: hypothetical protein JST22_02690 [Bacteroidetes bacterium]|nr:hypothetical protein [Bacteroidota bacterium]